LLSKEYAKERIKGINWEKNDPDVKPGDPYPLEGKENPFHHLLEEWTNIDTVQTTMMNDLEKAAYESGFLAGTTSIQAADKEGWVVSVTASGGWIPACIAGKTGIGMSQRMQSFVLDERKNPYNVVAPGKRPRGKPYLSFAVQGGDTQDQNLLQFFLNVVEFGMNVQEACEAANITSYQMQSSFEKHVATPGRLTLNEFVPPWVRNKLKEMGYDLGYRNKTSGPITAIYFDWQHGTFWGGASDYGEDYGIAW
jgi:gamma-glutamyltranspeptidase/glutathione hydrolase